MNCWFESNLPHKYNKLYMYYKKFKEHIIDWIPGFIKGMDAATNGEASKSCVISFDVDGVEYTTFDGFSTEIVPGGMSKITIKLKK